MTALICSDCQYENEQERVYCHNCGARLDRSGVVRKENTAESARETQKRLKRLFDPAGARTKSTLMKAARVIFGALCCAALILVLLPRELPPEPKNYDFGPMIGMDLVSANSGQNGAPLVYTEQDVNSYLASLVRRKGTRGTTGWFALQRVVVQFEEDQCTLSVQRKILGQVSICPSTSYRVRLESGKIIAEPTRAFVGQMPIHPALLKAGNPLLQSTWAALTRERTSVAKLSRIEFHAQSVRLVPH